MTNRGRTIDGRDGHGFGNRHGLVRVAGFDENGSAAGHAADPAGEGVVRKEKPAKVKTPAVVEIHPDWTVKGYGGRSVPVGDNLKRIGCREVENCVRNGHFRGHYLPARFDAGAAPVVGAAIIDIAAAIRETHDGEVRGHLLVIAIGGTFGNAIEQSAGYVQ